MKANKQDHIEPGKQIKIILAMFFDRQYKAFSHTEKITPGSIHVIIDRPSQKSRKNGDMGVWIEGTSEVPIFVRNFGWIPYFPRIEMTRTKPPEMRRIKHVEFQRIRK